MRDILVHLFVPLHTNNHRAKVLHVDSLMFLAVLYMGFYLVTGWVRTEYPDVLGYATDIRVEQLVALVNAKRAEHSLGPLTLNSELSQAAAGKAQDMLAKNYWAHTSPDGKVPWDFILGAGYQYSVAGENLAKNFSDSNGVITAWMNSSSHRDNLLKPGYRDIGFAVVNGVLNGEETTLVVQMFGSPKAVAAVVQKPIVKVAQAEEPTVVTTSVPATGLVEIPKEASAIAVAETNNSPATSGYYAATREPLIDRSALTKNVTYILGGLIIAVLLLDAWIVRRRRIVRIAGHNLAHALFVLTILYLVSQIVPGVVL